MSRDLPILLIWVHRKFTSWYLCQWRTRISRSSWRSVHGSMHNDIHAFTVRTRCRLRSSFESFNLSRGYWDPCPYVPFRIPFYYLWVACALGFPFPLYFLMALVIFLLSWIVAAINEEWGQYIHQYQDLCFPPSSGTSPIWSAEDTPPKIVSNWCSLPSIFQTGFNHGIMKTLGTCPLGVNKMYPKSKCPCKLLPIFSRNNNKSLTVNTQWGHFLLLFVKNSTGENSWVFFTFNCSTSQLPYDWVLPAVQEFFWAPSQLVGYNEPFLFNKLTKEVLHEPHCFSYLMAFHCVFYLGGV